MNQSVRERIVQAVLAALTPVAAALHASLIRSPTTAVSRELSPALLLMSESDQVSERSNDRVQRQLVLRMTALARDQGSLRAMAIVDELLVAAHSALFASSNLAGLAMGVQELDSDFLEEDADADIAAIPARYQITYRTMAHDISMIG